MRCLPCLKQHKDTPNVSNEEVFTRTYLDGYLSVVEINDDDVANFLRIGDAGIVTASDIVCEHLQSGAFDL